MPRVLVDKELDLYVHYEDWGEGDKYIFTSQTYPDYYAAYARELSKRGFHVIAIQMRGCGKSSRIPEGHNAQAYWADDVLTVADYLGVDKFVYTGISHGSGVGFTILLEHPERLLAFAGVVCGPKLKGHPSSFSWRERSVAEFAGITADEWKARCERGRAGTLRQIRPYHSDYWKEEIRKFADYNYDSQVNMDPDERQVSFGPGKEDVLDTEEKMIAWLKTITTPCIIFGGMQDPIIIPEAMFRTIRYLPNCKMVMYQDADHGVSIAYGDDVADEIENFLRSRKVF